MVGNSKADLAQITGESARLVVKLHGDLKSPNDIVLTTSQYTEFETGGARAYFRQKLISIFQMVPVVVVGHSMTDRDLRLVLQCAAESINPDKPTYVIVADATPAQIDKFYREYNIHLLSYPNPDKTHANLIHLLRQIDRFVIPRTKSPTPPLDFPDSAEAERGVSLYVHSSLGFGTQSSLLQRVLQPQLLNAVAGQPARQFLAQEVIASLTPDSLRKYGDIQSEIANASERLRQDGLIEVSDAGFKATPKGKDRLEEIKRRREIEEDQVFGALAAKLQPHGTTGEVDMLVRNFKKALLGVFRRRGLATAELLFRDNPFQPPDMPELFSSVFPPAAEVQNFPLRAEYCGAVMDLLTGPTAEQRRYLANLAQGFFAYHMFGLDPTGREIRRRLAQNTVWLFDSNIVIPLLAQGCEHHPFITELLSRLKSIGIVPITTPAFVAEVAKTLRWVKTQLQAGGQRGERETLLQLVNRPDYGGNPFIDGLIRGHPEGRWSTFGEYIERIGLQKPDAAMSAIRSVGIRVVEPLRPDDSPAKQEVARLSQEILVERERAGTLRAGVPQADAEAEALQLIRQIRVKGFEGKAEVNRAFFVSTSPLLDKMYKDRDGLLTWFPETLFKHLQFLSADPINADLMFESIATSYYSSGINLIDEDAYVRYFKPAITESGMVLKREVDNFAKNLTNNVDEQQAEKLSLLRRYESTPDREKPHFVSQLGWLAARKAEKRAEIAEAAAAQAKHEADERVKGVAAEYARKEKERQRHEEGRLRNLRDPKHLRKRARQAKKRKRKGR